MKYDNMMLRNRKVNREKKEKAMLEIRKLLADEEMVPGDGRQAYR